MAAAIALIAMAAAPACKGGDAPAAGKEGGGRGKGGISFPVVVAPVAAANVEYTISAVGSVEAFERVQLTARIAGAVERVRFREGETVKKGQVLVEIDPARYTVAVRSAKASLEKALAAQGEAKAGLDRREVAGAEDAGVFSAEELQTWRSRARSSGAAVAEAQAMVDTAAINLRDAFIRAPVEGKIQTRTVETGQYVQPGAILATLIQRDPLLLRFQVPEADAERLKEGMIARFKVRSDPRPFTSKITQVADAADMTTRMVIVTAEIDDAMKQELRPGAFAEVTVPVGESSGAPVIPQTAVRPSEKGFLAYVVENGAAVERVLELGLRTADGHVEVKSGVKPGEILVIRGAEALRDGVPVRAAPEGAGSSSASASAAAAPPASSSAPPRASASAGAPPPASSSAPPRSDP
jgi:membrane fusion protein, multidrug efflux system